MHFYSTDVWGRRPRLGITTVPSSCLVAFTYGHVAASCQAGTKGGWGGCTARCSTCCTLSGASHDGVPRRPWERKTRDPSRNPASPSANLGNRQRQNRPLLSWRPGPELNNSPGDPEAPTAPLAIVLHKGPSDAVKESSGRRREDFCPPSDGGHRRQTEASGGMRYESQLWANGEGESPLTTFPHPLNPT